MLRKLAMTSSCTVIARDEAIQKNIDNLIFLFYFFIYHKRNAIFTPSFKRYVYDTAGIKKASEEGVQAASDVWTEQGGKDFYVYLILPSGVRFYDIRV